MFPVDDLGSSTLFYSNLFGAESVVVNAAGEVYPVWPSQPITAHWGMPDPAGVEGSPAAIALAFADTWRMLSNRVRLFTSLPIESLDRLAIKRRMDDIGHGQATAQPA